MKYPFKGLSYIRGHEWSSRNWFTLFEKSEIVFTIQIDDYDKIRKTYPGYKFILLTYYSASIGGYNCIVSVFVGDEVVHDNFSVEVIGHDLNRGTQHWHDLGDIGSDQKEVRIFNHYASGDLYFWYKEFLV